LYSTKREVIVRKQFSLLLGVVTVCGLGACTAEKAEVEQYNASTKQFVSRPGAYKVDFPEKPRSYKFDDYNLADGVQGPAEQYAQENNLKEIYANEWNTSKIRMTSTFIVDNDNTNPATASAAFERAWFVCKTKFNLSDKSREPFQTQSGSGMIIKGNTKTNDTFKLYILLNTEGGVDNIFLVTASWDKAESEEARKFFETASSLDRKAVL
jgi:hypothetical protein